MPRILALALTLGVLGGLAAACGDGEPPPPTPEGPTTLSLTKSVTMIGIGAFRFTLVLTNEGDHAAVNVAASDVWDEALEVTAIGSVEGQQPEDIGDLGLEIIFREMAAGKRVNIVYTARCRQSGTWQNVATASAANADPVGDAVNVFCP